MGRVLKYSKRQERCGTVLFRGAPFFHRLSGVGRMSAERERKEKRK